MSQPNGQEQTMPFAVRGQYIKDFSFENPNPLKHLTEQPQTEPNITVDVQIQYTAVADKVFEVVLQLQVDAAIEKEKIFMVDLSYAGVITIGDLPEDLIKPLLLIHCPAMLFPFARNIVADAIRDGGFPQLLLAPVDFAYLYQQQYGEEAQEQATA